MVVGVSPWCALAVWSWAEWSKLDNFWLLVVCVTASAVHGVFLLCLVVPKWDFSVLALRLHRIRTLMRCKPVKKIFQHLLLGANCWGWVYLWLAACHSQGWFLPSLCSFPLPISAAGRGQWVHTSCFWMCGVEMILRCILNWSEKKQKPPKTESETEEKWRSNVKTMPLHQACWIQYFKGVMGFGNMPWSPVVWKWAEGRVWIIEGKRTFRKIIFMLLLEKLIPVHWALSIFVSLKCL